MGGWWLTAGRFAAERAFYQPGLNSATSANRFATLVAVQRNHVLPILACRQGYWPLKSLFKPVSMQSRSVSFDGAVSETEIQEARGASRGNGVLGATDADSLSLRFGLQSMYFLTDFFADRRERATSKLAPRASRSSATLNAPSNSGSARTGSTAEHCSLAPRSPLRASVSLCEQKIHRRVAHPGTKSPQPV